MSFVLCHICGRGGDEMLAYCGECGARRTTVSVIIDAETARAASYDRRSADRLTCPDCGGGQFKRLSLLHATGVPGVADAPPLRGSVLSFAIGGMAVVAGILGLTMSAKGQEWAALFCLVGAGTGLWVARAASLHEWQSRIDRWNRTLRCDDCGAIATL